MTEILDENAPHVRIVKLEAALRQISEMIQYERKEREREGNHYARVCDWAANQLGYVGTDDFMADFLRAQDVHEDDVQARCGPVSLPGKKRETP